MAKTSSIVKNKWNAKTYNRYTFFLRKEDDKEYITFIENQRKGGKTIRDIVREGIDAIVDQ